LLRFVIATLSACARSVYLGIVFIVPLRAVTGAKIRLKLAVLGKIGHVIDKED